MVENGGSVTAARRLAESNRLLAGYYGYAKGTTTDGCGEFYHLNGWLDG